jgi:hypothetical protein
MSGDVHGVMKDTNDFDSFSVAVAVNAENNEMPPVTPATGNMKCKEALRQIDGRLRSQSRRSGT